MLVGWKRLSFEANDMLIDIARAFVRNMLPKNSMMNIFAFQWKFIHKLSMV